MWKESKVSTGLTLLVALGLASASGEIDAAQETLKNLKDSGVLDGVKEKLGELLKDTNIVADAIKDKLVVNSRQGHSKEAFNHLLAYAKDNKLNLGKDLLKKLAAIKPGNGVAMDAHFSQLSGVANVIHKKVKSGSINESGLLNFDFSSVSSLKDVLNKVVKDEGQAKANKSGSERKGQAKAAAGMVRAFTKMAASSPKLFSIALRNAATSSNVVSKEFSDTLGGFLESTEFVNFIAYYGESLADFLDSDLADELVYLIPMLWAGEGDVFGTMVAEKEKQWMEMMDELTNSDVRANFLAQCGQAFSGTYNYLMDTFNNEMKFTVLNVVLRTQGLPMIDPINLVASMVNLTEQAMARFLPPALQVDIAPFKPVLNNFVVGVEQEYLTVGEFKKLSDDERSKLIARFLDDNVISVMEYLGKAHRFVLFEERRDCAEYLLCSMNEHARNGPKLKQELVLRGLSMLLGWRWSIAFHVDANEFYQAAELGAEAGKKCSDLYATSACELFQWQKQKMSLDFDHGEL